jgi:hypothetical protein
VIRRRHAALAFAPLTIARTLPLVQPAPLVFIVVMLAAAIPGCDLHSPPERVRPASGAPCPTGRFPAHAEHRDCVCPVGQDKRDVGMFDLVSKCLAPPTQEIEEARVDIDCAEPPASCVYEGQILSGPVGQVTCGKLVCPEPTCAIHCAPPSSNCRYVGQLPAGPCGKVTCGKLLCEESPRCEDGERRLETCWSDGERGLARYTCEDGRWQQGVCQLGESM